MARRLLGGCNPKAIFLLLACLTACGDDKDRKAPPSPFLDPVTSPTNEATQTVSGSAEPGSTVRIEGGMEPVEAVADEFTARWWAEVALNTGDMEVENKLGVTATDAAGNTSEPATATIVYLPTPAPAAPTVDPVTSPTMLPTQILSGSAEPGSTVRVEGGAEPVETTADSFTGRFYATVALDTEPASGETSVENVLSVTATADGRTSKPSVVKIVYETPRAVGMTLEVAPETVLADDGVLLATARISGNGEFTDLSGFDVTFSVSGIKGVKEQTSKTDFQGVAEARFEDLRKATKEATVAATADTNPEATAKAAFRVVPGVPAELELVLREAGTAVDDPIAIGVGTELDAEITVTDAWGNETMDPVSLDTTIPGALVTGQRISKIEVTGMYEIVGSVAGQDVRTSRNVTVQAGAADHVELGVTPNPVVAGETAMVTAVVVDAFGNDTGEAAVLGSTPDVSAHADCAVMEGFVAAGEFRTCHSGDVEITADFTGATSAQVTLAVVPAAATNLAFALTGAAADGTIKAGEDATYDYEVTDDFGNPTATPIQVVINHPGSSILDDGLSGSGLISGLVRSSATPYTITARVSGTAVTETRPLTIGVADGTRTVALTLSLNRMAVGDTLLAFATVRDLYGNLVTTPAPTFSIKLGSGAAAPPADYMQAGNAFTINEPEIYMITATFNDGTNPEATDSQFVLVEAVPDLMAPSLRIVRVNGFGVCADGTLAVNIPADCPGPAITFGRGDLVIVDVEVDDDRSLSEVSFKAFGNGVSASDFALVAAGQHTPGTPLTLQFSFLVNDTAFPGDATIVAQAVDGTGNRTNSSEALIRIDLGLVAQGGRTMETVAAGAPLTLTNPYDVAVSPLDSDIYVANRDTSNSVLRVQGPGLGTFQTFGDRPEYLAFDAVGNLFVTLDAADEIWRVEPDRTRTLYVDPGDPGAPGNPEGLATLGANTPGAGRFIFNAAPADQDCVDLGGQVYEFNSGGGCAGAGGNCSVAQDVCVAFTGGSRTSAMNALQTAINADPVVNSALTAFQGVDCEGTGDPCVFLVNDSAGPGAPTVLDEPSGNGRITFTNIGGGESASLLYAGDRGGPQLIHEYQAPLSPRSAPLNTYDPNQPSRGIAVDLSGAPARLFLFNVDSGADQLNEFDTGPAVNRTIADAGDGLDGPWDVVLSSNRCLLVSNVNSGEILAIGNFVGAGPITVELVADGFSAPRGMALEGTGETANLIVTDSGFDIVMRITPTVAMGDCF